MPVDPVIADFEQHLQMLRSAHAGRPHDEMRQLWLMALEREKLVTVAYRRDIIDRRLGQMAIPDDVRRAVAQAIRWVWRDEEMHALYIRGALLQSSSLPERLHTWTTQAGGAIAGWTASRQHHNRWSEAPVTRGIAELAELAGVVVGKVPDGVRGDLQFGSFRAFAAFSIAAERTARLGWLRMAELERTINPHSSRIEAFERMAFDEDRHAALFGVLEQAFDEADGVCPGVQCEPLVAQIGAIGQRFLAEPSQGAAAWENPVGKGAVVVVHQAETAQDGPKALDDVLQRLGLPDLLADRQPSDRPLRVAVKTSFMLITRRDGLFAGVSPTLLRALCGWLVERNVELSLIDAQNIYDRFHRNRGVRPVARWLGLMDPRWSIVDAQQDQVGQVYHRGLCLRTISAAWKQADVRVLFGKLRSHPTTFAMLSLEVAEGLGSRHDGHVFGDRELERELAILMQLDALPPDVSLIDAFTDVPDGLLGMMHCDEPMMPLRIYGSRDPVALDSVLLRHIKGNPDDPRTLVSAAFDWFGDPRERTQVDGPDSPLPNWRAPDATRRTALLSALAAPIYSHGSARGALFLPAFDEQAFPPITPQHPAVQLARAAVERLLQPSLDRPREGLLPVKRCRIDGHLLRMTDHGAGPVVVLLHGYPETLQIWSRVVPRLSKRFRVITFDWPGLGYSDAWPGGHSPHDLAARLERILDGLELDQVHLVGSDMGGQPALLFAASNPERVLSVSVLNSLLFADAATSWEIGVMRRPRMNRAAFMLAPGVVYRQCRRTFLPPHLQLSHALDADFAGAFLQRSVRQCLAAMCAAYEVQLPTLPDQYWQVRCPTLALWGGGREHFGIEHAERLVALLPNAVMRTIQGGRHWMAWSHAGPTVHALIRNFERAMP